MGLRPDGTHIDAAPIASTLRREASAESSSTRESFRAGDAPRASAGFAALFRKIGNHLLGAYVRLRRVFPEPATLTGC
jgi:hypothetical protein